MMAGSGRKNADGRLAVLLAAGLSVAKAAKKAKVGERTVYRRLKDPDFRRRVEEARAAMVEKTVGKLAAIGNLAVGQLHGLMSKETTGEQVRLGAARAALDFLFRSHEQQTLAKQVEDLRRQVEEISNHGHGNPAPPSGQAEGGAGAADAAGDLAAGPHPPRPGDDPNLRWDDTGLMASNIPALKL
jgi:hypothetical protein